MKALVFIVGFAAAVAAIGYMVAFTRSALSSRQDRKRLQRERATALDALSRIRDIASPYILMGDQHASLLANAIMGEIHKADDVLRKEIG